jgi:hypothetical protein
MFIREITTKRVVISRINLTFITSKTTADRINDRNMVY